MRYLLTALNLRFLVLLTLTYIVFIIFYFVFLPSLNRYQEKLNESIQTFTQKEYTHYQKIKFDPFVDNILAEIEDENYDLFSDYNSAEIQNLSSKSGFVKNLLREKKFDSYEDIMLYFIPVIKDSIEIQLIREIVRNDIHGSGFTVVTRLNRLYISILTDYFNDSEYDRLAEFSNRAFLGFRSVDLESSEEYSNSAASRIILSKALFEYPHLVARNKEAFQILLHIFIENFPREKRSYLKNINENDNEITYLKKYWEAVYSFNDGKFSESKQTFKMIGEESNNFALYNTARLMEARCVFWEAYSHKSSIDSLASIPIIIELNEIANKIKYIHSYNTDIEFYINEIKCWSLVKNENYGGCN